MPLKKPRYSKGDKLHLDDSEDSSQSPRAPASDRYAFVGLNGRVFALNKRSGRMVWEWQAKKGMGYVSLHLDGDILIAGVQGYIYALNPKTGRELWNNPLKGKGLGIVSLCTRSGSVPSSSEAHAILANS